MKSDPAHKATDDEIAKLEKLIAKEYKKAHKEVSAKLDDYLARFANKDAKWQEWVAAGTKTKKEYIEWRKGQMMVGQRWEDLRDSLAHDYTEAAKIANSICKDFAPGVYALNHNYATFEVEKKSLIDTSYTLYSRESVEHMYKGKPKLYHTYGKAVAKQIKEGKQYPWDRRRITSVLTQGIIQGESISGITKRLEKVTVGDHKAAIRNARTMMTGVQNAGRIDAYQRALDMGIPVKKQWLATLDMRTRHWHKELDGTAVENDEPFTNEIGDIMFPGDPNADAANVYNCFVGDTKIATDSNIVRSYKHDYSGQLFTIKSASGIEFTCTPNHPILTASGWVAAERLKYGDNLLIASVRKDDSLRINPHVNHTFARIDALHNLFKIMGGKRTTSLSVNFHGDIPASDVEIITQKWFLGSDWNTGGSNSVDKFLLKHANKTFMGKSAFVKHFWRIGFTSLGFVSSLSKALAFVFRGMRHTVVHSFGSIAGGDAIVLETKTDNMSRDSKLICKGLNGSSSIVFADDIVDIKVSSVSHLPVYNLQTENGYYFVNSIIAESEQKCNYIGAIAHNCRCTLIAQIKGFEIDTQNTDLRHDDKLGGMSYEEWLDAKSVSNPITLPEEKAAAIQGAWWKKYGGAAGPNHAHTAAEGKALMDKYAQEELTKQYSGIWANKTVTPADYPNMKKDIVDKKFYINKQLEKAKSKSDSAMLAKYQQMLDDINDFEKQGKKWVKANPGAVKTPKTPKTPKSAVTAPKAPKVQNTAKAPTGGVQCKQSTVKAAPKTEAQAAKAVKDIEAEISALDQKQWPTIWYGGVEPKDYPLKKSKIAEKKAYYQGKIDDAIASGDTAALKKYKPLLKYTEEFEKYGMLWEQKQLELQAAKDALKPFEDAKKAKEAAKAAKEQAKKDAKKAALKADMDILDQKDYDLSFLGFYGDNHVKLADYEKIKKNIKEFKKAYGSSPWFADEMEALTAFENDLKARKKLQAAMDKLGGKKVSPKDAAFVNPDPKKTIAKAKSFSYDYHERNNFDRGIWNALSQKAREGLQKYTGSYYEAMNDVMRGLRRVDARVADLINGATEAVRAFKLKEDTKLWRGMGSKNSLARALKMDAADIAKMLDDGSIVGQVFTEDGFGSTAATKERAWDKDIMLEIFAPEGTEAMYVDPVSRHQGEKEILLQRGTRFEIIGVNKETSRWGNERYWLKVVILDQTPKKF